MTAQQAQSSASNGRSESHATARDQSSNVEDFETRLAALEMIFSAEERARGAKSELELVNIVANDIRKLAGARQVFVLRRTGKCQSRVMAVSSVALVDRDTPLIRWIEGIANRIQKEAEAAGQFVFELPAYASPDLIDAKTYPFKQFIWQPLELKNGDVFASCLIAREQTWTVADKQLITRLACNLSTSWAALAGPRTLRPSLRRRGMLKLALGALAILGCFVPVPMTTLAPAEIIADNPHRVFAKIDGVIAELPILANQPVSVGEVILRFDETTLRNELQISEQALRVAKSRYDRLRQSAFSDANARHELAIVRNDVLLKRAERDYARSRLEKTVLKADRDGVLIYSDRNKLIGKPVHTGERLLDIVEPSEIAVQVELPVADAIALEEGSSVRVFLDSNPLVPVSGELFSKSYQAEPNSTQQLVYRLYARFGQGAPDARIGTRGTAQLYGSMVPLIYFLLRRPISAARQYFGI